MTEGLHPADRRIMRWLAKHRVLMTDTERHDPRRMERYHEHARRIYKETKGQFGWKTKHSKT